MVGEVTEKQSYEQTKANNSSNQDEFDALCQQRQVPTFQRPVEPRGGGEYFRIRWANFDFHKFAGANFRFFTSESAAFP